MTQIGKDTPYVNLQAQPIFTEQAAGTTITLDKNTYQEIKAEQEGKRDNGRSIAWQE